MRTATSFSLALSLLTGLCYGDGILTDLHNGAVEGNVTLSTTLPPTVQPHASITWSINGTHILTHRKDRPTDFSPGYENRVTLNITTGSLELRSLTMTDSGQYAVSIVPATGLPLVGTTELHVLERVAGVSISSSSPTVIERMSVNLTCAASGSIITREWMKDGVPLSPSDRVSFSGDKTTVSINPVNRNDDGVYLCQVSNLVSTACASYELVVNFGPDHMIILAPETAVMGSITLLYCYVKSMPPANFTWLFKGGVTGVHEAGYVIEESSDSDSGDYTCSAYNDVTNLTQSVTYTLTVEDRPPSPVLSPGASAGIAVAVTLVVVALVVGLYFGLTYHLNKTKGSVDPGRERQKKHTKQKAAGHDPGHDNLQFNSLQELTNQTSREPKNKVQNPVSRNREKTYENISYPSVSSVQAPPVPPRSKIPPARTRPDLESKYDTQLPR